MEDTSHAQSFGKLKKLPVATVWDSENKHFTPWLAQNLKYLSDQIGLDLELVAMEVPVGPFKVDLVARVSGTDDVVVVENQFGSTDHDHLGKLMTYAAGQDASYAIWVAEHFRPEHRSALEWANRTSVEGVGYFGMRIEALQIENSPPAVQLVAVVEPDQWAKQAPKPASESPRAQLYREFWEPVLEGIKNANPGWTNASTPSKESWMTLPAGTSLIWYAIAFTADNHLRIELYVDGGDAVTQKELWQRFESLRSEIDAAAPGPLTWEELPTKKASRIAWYYPQSANVDYREQWDSMRQWIIQGSGEFRDAVQPYVEQVLAKPAV